MQQIPEIPKVFLKYDGSIRNRESLKPNKKSRTQRPNTQIIKGTFHITNEKGEDIVKEFDP
jgi:hypothetical protein